MNRAGNEFFAGSSFAGDQHAFGVAGDAIHHAHEAVHHWTGEYKVRALNLARNGVRRLVFIRALGRVAIGKETGPGSISPLPRRAGQRFLPERICRREAVSRSSPAVKFFSALF